MIKYLGLISIAIVFLLACQDDDDTGEVLLDLSFEKTYGGIDEDKAFSAIIENNELYLFGTTKSFNDVNGDYYLLKLDLNGNVIFEKSFGGGLTEEGFRILATNDGNFLLIGSTESTGNGLQDIHAIKINGKGNILWENTYGGSLKDTPIDIIETADGEFCIAGTTESYGSGSRDIYLVWINQNGTFLRQAVHGGVDIDGSSSLLELNNKNIMVYGYTKNYGATSRDFYLLKVNTHGDSLWSKRYGGSGYEESQAFQTTIDGGFVLNGHSSSTDTNHNMYAVKLDSNGTVIWDKNFGGSQHDGGQALLINKEGNYVFIGRSMSFENGDRNIYMVTTDPNGRILSTDVIGGSNGDWGQSILEHYNYYYIVGHSNSYSNGNDDVYLIKYRK